MNEGKKERKKKGREREGQTVRQIDGHRINGGRDDGQMDGHTLFLCGYTTKSLFLNKKYIT